MVSPACSSITPVSFKQAAAPAAAAPAAAAPVAAATISQNPPSGRDLGLHG